MLQVLLAIAQRFVSTAVYVGSLAKRGTTHDVKGARNNLPVFSPLRGVAVPLSARPEFACATGSVGLGLAMRRLSGGLFAPFDATVVAVYPASHAIVLRHVRGLEVLIHIAVDAETSYGKHFTPMVGCGQQVAAGSLVAAFDHAAVRAAGHDTIASVLVLNSDRYPHIVPLAHGSIAYGEALFMAIAVGHCESARLSLQSGTLSSGCRLA